MIINRLPQIKEPDLLTPEVARLIFEYQTPISETGKDILLYRYTGPPDRQEDAIDAASEVCRMDGSLRYTKSRRIVPTMGFVEVARLQFPVMDVEGLEAIITSQDLTPKTFLFMMLS